MIRVSGPIFFLTQSSIRGCARNQKLASGEILQPTPSAVVCSSSNCGWFPSRTFQLFGTGAQAIGQWIFRLGFIEDGLCDGPAGLCEGLPVVRRHAASLKMDLRHAPVIPIEKTQQHFSQIATCWPVECPSAEISGNIASSPTNRFPGVGQREKAIPKTCLNSALLLWLERHPALASQSSLPLINGDAMDAL